MRPKIATADFMIDRVGFHPSLLFSLSEAIITCMVLGKAIVLGRVTLREVGFGSIQCSVSQPSFSQDTRKDRSTSDEKDMPANKARTDESWLPRSIHSYLTKEVEVGHKNEEDCGEQGQEELIWRAEIRKSRRKGLASFQLRVRTVFLRTQ